ncbi:hypothetical protein ZWY2020_058465 [Hordeum vulgare]|nr:hypothetical protein ZWY2020_058465 [Hordeum vulgare]
MAAALPQPLRQSLVYAPLLPPFAYTRLVCSYGSASADMDELCLQRIVRTGHRMALEGYDRGSRSGCRMPLPTSTEAGGCHRCLLPRAVPVGYHRYTTTRSAAASVHGYQHSLAWEENVNHGQLESREEKPSPGALPEEFVADVIGCGRRRWPTLAGRRWRNSGLAGRTSHHSVRMNDDIEERHQDQLGWN